MSWIDQSAWEVTIVLTDQLVLTSLGGQSRSGTHSIHTLATIPDKAVVSTLDADMMSLIPTHDGKWTKGSFNGTVSSSHPGIYPQRVRHKVPTRYGSSVQEVLQLSLHSIAPVQNSPPYSHVVTSQIGIPSRWNHFISRQRRHQEQI